MIGLITIMKYSSTKDKALAIFGVLFSVLAGLVAPTVSIVMGELIAIYDPRSTPDEINNGIEFLIKVICAISLTLWVFSYVQYAFMQHAAEKLAFELRFRYLNSLMR